MSQTSDTKFAFIYVIDPPQIITRAIPLLFSLRALYPDIAIYPYARQDRYDLIPHAIHDIHEHYNAPIQKLDKDLVADPLFAEPYYRQGNKLIASAMERPVDFTVFLDTDTFLAKPLCDPKLFQTDRVAAIPESVSGFSKRFDERWDVPYGMFGLSVPEERVKMLRTDREVPPYYNAGFVIFPERTPKGDHFGQLWLDTAIKMDHNPEILHKSRRPWLDQGALPVAVYRAGMRFETLDSNYNYPLDGKDFFPHDDVILYHYHSIERLEAAGYQTEVEKLFLAAQTPRFKSWDDFVAPEKMLKEKSLEYVEIRDSLRDVIAQKREAQDKLNKKGSSEERNQWQTYKHEIKELLVTFENARDKIQTMSESDFISDEWGMPAP